jgi:type VI secretion system protein ImpA
VTYEFPHTVEELLSPIPGDKACGANLMYEGLHDQIREARRADDVLAQGDWKRNPKTADWHVVIDLSVEALASKTKDLQVAAWLAEALVNLCGFDGLLTGIRLISGMIEQYWDGLYPEIDEGDLEARANAVDLLNRPFFLAALQKIPITGNPMGVNYSYLEYKDSTRFDIPDSLENLAFEERERFSALKLQADTEGKITSEQWRKVKGASNRAFYEALFSQLNLCRAGCKQLDDLLDAKFQRQTPGLADFRKTLDAVYSAVETIVAEKRILEPDPAVASTAIVQGGDTAGGASAAGLRTEGVLSSREEALQRLFEVAEFFRTTEPHSPVSYLIQRAIRWGQIPLEMWLDEVVKDQSVLAHIRETLGIKPNEG